MSDKKSYEWRRFWVPREGSMQFDENGFLADPEDEYYKQLNPRLVSLDEIVNIPCLVLLGEPGIGKSTALERVKDRAEANTKRISIDLRSYGSEDRLHRAIFESKEFFEWMNSSHCLKIFLDSLDECLVHTRTVAALLADEFRKYPTSRLSLRVACRTAVWPALLQEELPKIWGAGNYGVYELAPLRRVDVVDAIKIEGLDPQKFLREVAHREVSALATKPITLQFLMQVFRDQNELPVSQAELYLQGCERLCRDEKLSRIASGAAGQLSPGQRLAIAQWIAAVTMFCKRSAIYIGVDEDRANPEDITVSQLSGIRINGISLEITPTTIREVVATGLFSGRAGSRMGWSHWTFAEFLSARFVVTSELTEPQIADLIIHPKAELVEGSRVVPQLQEIAAWIASMRPDFIDDLVSSDPQVLLRSSLIDSLDRPKLVASMLRLLDAGKLTDTTNDLRRKYKILIHTGLAEQIEPYIVDRHKNVVARRAAIDIAEACEVVSLLDVLLAVSLDESDSSHIRAQAAHAIVQIGSSEQRLKLRPLLDCSADEDPDEDLKGLALQALWPEYMSAEELFTRLTLPRNDSYYGTYSSFLHDQILENLTERDLLVALDWVRKQPEDDALSFDLQSLIAGVMRRAWLQLENESVLRAFVEAALTRIERHEPIVSVRFDQESQEVLFASDADKRHKLILALLPQLQSRSIRLTWLCFNPNRLVSKEDVEWLIGLLTRNETSLHQEQLAELVTIVFDRQSASQIDTILSSIPKNTGLARAFEAFTQPIRLNSQEAQQAKAVHLEFSGPTESAEESLPRPLSEILNSWLDKFEAGDLDAWWRMNLDMTLKPTSNRYPSGQELNSDLTTLPGWEELDSQNRVRCVAAALVYLDDGDPRTAEWLGTNKSYRSAAAGYRALRLLQKENSGTLRQLSPTVWSKWAPVILAYWEPGQEATESMEELLSMAYRSAPQAVISALSVLIEHESRDYKRVFVIRKMRKCWDEGLTAAVVNIVRNHSSADPFFRGNLVDELLPHGGDSALAFAMSLLEIPVAPGGVSRDRTREVMLALLNRVPGKSFATIWPAIKADAAFGRELFLELASRHEQGQATRFVAELPEELVAGFYVWLAREFPHSEDPKHKGVYTVGDRDMIKDYRDSLLALLKGKGTVSAFEAVRRIEKELPSVNWLMYETLEAGRITLEKTWHGQTPEALLKLTRNERVRLVESGDQLLDVIIDSLTVLEAKLQGETPLAPALWNDNRTPKSENWLSDFVKVHLSEDLKTRGIVANREVEIRAGAGKPGEITDIHVDAVGLDTNGNVLDRITAIIETKGCWHRDISTAMQTQLKDRYLKDNQCHFGLYLVGWFTCSQWSDDYRREQTPEWTLKDARVFFDKQAAEMSGATIRIRAFVLNTALR